MKLHEVPNHTTIRVLAQENGDPPRVPPAAPEIRVDDVLDFLHIDGMFSACYNSQEQLVHLVAWAEVEIVEKSP
jgi:hypothetical protein